MSDPPTATLVCPKCHATLRSYERNGITIDQCQECRGIFLDRGELERLIDTDKQRYENPPADQPRYRDQPAYPPGYDARHSDSNHGTKSGRKRKRGGLLGELFD